MEKIKAAQEQFGKLIESEFQRIEKMKKDREAVDFSSLETIVIGVLPGDGIGPIIMKQALRVIQKLLKPELDPRFAVTHWAAQSMDWDHWLVDGFSAYMAFLPMEKEAPVFRKIPERLAAMVPRAVRTGRETLPALADMLSRDSAHSAAEHGVSSRGGTLQYWADLLWIYIDSKRHNSSFITSQ